MKKKLIIFLFLFVCIKAFPQTDTNFVIGYNYTIYSEVLKEERQYSVYLPKNYSEMDLKYPVLITLDGYFLWPVGIVDYLSFAGNIPEIIIVSIQSTDRDRDFTPTNAANIEGEYISTSGGADKFLSFLETELMPAIDNNYRTENFRIFAGHSLGGLLVTYTLLKNPALFQAYIAISPTLPWDNEWILNNTDLYMKQKYERNIYYSLIIDNQEGIMFEAANNFIEKISKMDIENFRYFYKRYENEDHISCFTIGLYDSLRELYEKYKISENLIETANCKDIKEHFTTLTEKYGYTIVPTWDWLNWIANWHFLMKRNKESINLYLLASEYYPCSCDVYLKLAEVYRASGLFQDAIFNYNIALKYCTNESERAGIIKTIQTIEKQ